MNDRLISTITFCKKANKLILGFDVVMEAVDKGEAKLLLLASDLSAKTRKEVQFRTADKQVPLVDLPITMDEIWMKVNKRAGILAVTEQGFANKLYDMLKPEGDVSKPIGVEED